MCLIAVSHSRFQELSTEFWERACAENSHGLGLMYVHAGRLEVRKALHYTVEDVIAFLREVPTGARTALHLRQATVGARDVENIHPFVGEAAPQPGLPSLFALMHNGTITALSSGKSFGPSDSQQLMHRWLLPRLVSRRQWPCNELASDLTRLLKNNNRAVLLDNHGRWQIFGEHEGFWRGGTWLSNPKAKAWLEGPDALQSDLFETSASA